MAQFFNYLSQPELQAKWHQRNRLRADHQCRGRADRRPRAIYEKNPGTDVAVKQLNNKPPTANSKGLRFGNFVQGRTVIEEEIEAVFAGKKDGQGRRWTTPSQRGNDILRKFAAANKGS